MESPSWSVGEVCSDFCASIQVFVVFSQTFVESDQFLTGCIFVSESNEAQSCWIFVPTRGKVCTAIFEMGGAFDLSGAAGDAILQLGAYDGN